jgi:hypothetical protein
MILTLDNQQLSSWFDDRLQHIRCARETRAYITGVLMERVRLGGDMPGRSIVLEYYEASQNGDFESFQRIGDWVLWSGVVTPGVFEAHGEVYESLGRLSYYACYRILQRRWQLYEELADELPRIVKESRLVQNHPIG